MLTVYGIKSCDTCRKAGLDIQMLERWTTRLGWERLLNKQSLTWRKIPEVDRASMSRDKALATMIEHPTLIKRPVLESAKFIAVGFAEKRFAAFLDENDI